MIRPSFAVRFAGSRYGSLLLFTLSGAAVLGWYGGHVRWWIAVAAVAAAMRTRTAIKSLRRYNAWAAEWETMGAEEDAPAPPQAKPTPRKQRSYGRLPVIIAGLAVLLIPFCLQPAGTPLDVRDGTLFALWVGAGLFLVFALFRGIARRVKKVVPVAVKAEAESRDDGTVACLVPRASSSPSRTDVERELPEYCARLLQDRAAGR